MSERLTVSAFARRAGCDEKQVRRALTNAKLAKGDDGRLDAAQLDTQWRRADRRTLERVSEVSEPKPDTSRNVRASEPAPSVREGETLEEAAERAVGELGLLEMPEARRRTENYLGLLRQLEYDVKSGAVVAVADVSRTVGEAYAKVRTRLLAIPAERAPQVQRLKTVVEVEDALRGFITEALEELTQDGGSV